MRKQEDVREVASQALKFAKEHQHQHQPGDHVSLGGRLRVAIFFAVWILGSSLSAAIGWALGGALGAFPGAWAGGFLFFLIAIWASHIVRVAAQWERGIVLRLGRFHRIKGPGVLLVFPIGDTVRFGYPPSHAGYSPSTGDHSR